MTEVGPARIRPLSDEEMSLESAALLERWRLDGQLYNIFRTMAVSPRLLRAWLPFGTHTYGRSSLTQRQTELLILRTTWLCASRYEFSHHVMVAQRRGLTREEIERVTRGPGAEGWAPGEAALLRAADELERDVAISDPTWDELSAELDDEQMMDVAYVCGAYRVGAMVMNSLRVELDDGIPPDTRIGAGRRGASS